MNKRHKHADLIHAWADGVEIQRATLSGNDWVDDSDPTWNVCHEYRIKPRTVKREGWVNIGKLHEGYFIMFSGEVFGSKEAALRYAAGSISTVKVEWEEVE